MSDVDPGEVLSCNSDDDQLSYLQRQRFYLIDCWLLNVQWQIFHAFSGREQVHNYQYRKGMGWETTGQRFLTATGRRE